MAPDIPHIDLSYDVSDSHRSALDLVVALFPDWAPSRDAIEFVRFTDGITNTVRSRQAPW
jgi:ethanolamine kinase